MFAYPRSHPDDRRIPFLTLISCQEPYWVVIAHVVKPKRTRVSIYDALAAGPGMEISKPEYTNNVCKIFVQALRSSGLDESPGLTKP